MRIFILLYTLLVCCRLCNSFYQSELLLPVFTRCRTNDHHFVTNIVEDQQAYGISVRPPSEIKCLQNLYKLKMPSTISAWDVSSIEQVKKLKELGCKTLSTNVILENVVREAQVLDINIVSEGSQLNDYESALIQNSIGFRYNTKEPLQYEDVERLISRIRLVYKYVEIPIFVTPELSAGNIEKIIALDGMINFIMDFDVERDTMENIQTTINNFNSELKRIYLNLKINGDLQNSCL